MGGPVRQAARQVSAYREIFIAAAAGIAVSYVSFSLRRIALHIGRGGLRWEAMVRDRPTNQPWEQIRWLMISKSKRTWKINVYDAKPVDVSLQGGLVWRSWHLSYKKGVEDYYKKYEEELKQKASS